MPIKSALRRGKCIEETRIISPPPADNNLRKLWLHFYQHNNLWIHYGWHCFPTYSAKPHDVRVMKMITVVFDSNEAMTVEESNDDTQFAIAANNWVEFIRCERLQECFEFILATGIDIWIMNSGLGGVIPGDAKV